MATEGDAASRVSLPTLTFRYATETGNAEEVAERVSQLAIRRHVPVRVYSLADYDRVRACHTPLTPVGASGRGHRFIRRFYYG